MKCRCPFPLCKLEFEDSTLEPFRPVNCPGCSRRFTSRTVERAQAIDLVTDKHRSLESLFGNDNWPDPECDNFVVLLEDIRSLWNVGSIFRSADGCGFSQLILTGITGYPPRKEIAKTSLGAEDHVRWSYAGSSLDVLPSLKELGYQVVALEKTLDSLDIGKALEQKLLVSPLCLLLGSEVTGLYLDTLDMADITVELPMRGFKTSLNVAVAFGIAGYTITERLFRQTS